MPFPNTFDFKALEVPTVTNEEVQETIDNDPAFGQNLFDEILSLLVENPHFDGHDLRNHARAKLLAAQNAAAKAEAVWKNKEETVRKLDATIKTIKKSRDNARLACDEERKKLLQRHSTMKQECEKKIAQCEADFKVQKDDLKAKIAGVEAKIAQLVKDEEARKKELHEDYENKVKKASTNLLDKQRSQLEGFEGPLEKAESD